MIQRLNKLLAFLVILAIPTYFFWLNPHSITVTFSSDYQVTAPAALILIGVFVAGMLFSALFAFFFGFKASLRESRLRNDLRKIDQARNALFDARAAQAIGDSGKARAAWQSILNKHPDDVPAAVELSRIVEERGDAPEALRIIDQVRAKRPDNCEVLWRAANLNVTLNNKTAAVDNLALILNSHPSARAAALARDLCEELARFDEALSYHKKYEQLGGDSSDSPATLARLTYKLLERSSSSEPANFRSQLKRLAKETVVYPEALEHLARLERDSGNFDEASKWLLKAAKLSGQPRYWKEAAQLWLEKGEPERALSAARAGVNESRNGGKIDAELELVRLYLSLNMVDEAQGAIERIEVGIKQDDWHSSKSQHGELLTLKAAALLQSGKTREALDHLRTVSEGEFHSFSAPTPEPVTHNGPSPILSAP